MANTFLFVDDDEDDTELFTEALAEIDATAILYTADNGVEALKRIQEKGCPSIIFLDVNMPRMNGLECLAELKKNPVCRNVPVIKYSTSANKHDTHTAGQLGALCFVTKPNEFGLLKQILTIVTTHLATGDIETLCKDLDPFA